MIEFELEEENAICIQVGAAVSKEDMVDIDFTVEALTASNPNTTIHFRMQDGIEMRWIKHLENLCEAIPNGYTIERVPKLSQLY